LHYASIVDSRQKDPVTDEASTVLAGQAEIVDAVLAANRVFVAVASNALASSTADVTLPQFRALVLLDANGTMSVAQLAEAMGVVPSTATRMCDRLVAKKLIRREIDQNNRRQMLLSLHAKGEELLAESTRRRKQQISRLLRAIPPAEQHRLAASLRVLVAAAER
jgi:DNA-binding MarR family transcriptional regulator